MDFYYEIYFQPKVVLIEGNIGAGDCEFEENPS